VSPQGRVNRGLVVASTMLATMLYAIDTTIANVALPHIQGGLQAGPDQVLWVLTSYIVVSAIATPIVGFLALRIGERRILLLSVAGFTIASMLCGIATSLPELVLFRALQGACGAALIPISQSCLLSVYPRERHGTALAIWGLGVMVGPVIGPTLGGWLTEALNWRWVFYINVPVGVLAWIGLTASLPRSTTLQDRRFDLKGFVMLALAIGLAQLALDRGNSQGWLDSTEIVAEMLFAGILFYMFLVHTLTTAHPFFEPRLFRDRNLVAGLITPFVVYPLIMVPGALLPVFMQQLQDHTAATAGLVMAPRGLGMAVAMLAGGRLISHMDSRLLAAIGLSIVLATCVMLVHITTDTSAASIGTITFFQGVGMGATFLCINVAAYATLPAQLRTEGAVLVTLGRTLSGAIGISIAGTLLTHSTAANQSRLVEYFSAFDPQRLAAATQLVGDRATAVLTMQVQQQATVIGYENVFAVISALALLALPMLLLFKLPKRTPTAPEAANAEALH
jgi:MFS transporter, DHA2 family, multidrug resistance protein